MKVALAHDHLAQDGGAEKVLKVLLEMYPKAPIYTLLYEKENADRFYSDRNIEASIIQRLPGGIKHYKWYMPFMPMAVEFFDLSKYDVVISSASALIKGVITKPDTLHICYCHTPTRYLWSDTHEYINDLKYNKYFKKIISLVLNYIRIWDRQAADRVDVFVANSKTVQKRIKKYYKQDSKVIYPPVDTKKFGNFRDHLDEKLQSERYFLIGCRLASYKRVDLAIKAFKKMPDKKLKIFGDGIDRQRLEKIAGDASNIEFLGRVDDAELARYYANAQAFLNPQEEDFGITAVEAISAGTPVIAYRKGGATETVVAGESGVFFDRQRPEDLIRAVENFKADKFNKDEISRQAERFSIDNFKKNLESFIKEECEKHAKE
ncbi:glycosyltransferase [Candidatus Falkowbacteria bacterium]|nr:glycosyltransferase [Candidatus Falkowbacteria bacterium]